MLTARLGLKSSVTGLNKVPTTGTEHLRYQRKVRDNTRVEVERN